MRGACAQAQHRPDDDRVDRPSQGLRYHARPNHLSGAARCSEQALTLLPPVTLMPLGRFTSSSGTWSTKSKYAWKAAVF